MLLDIFINSKPTGKGCMFETQFMEYLETESNGNKIIL